MDRRRRNNFFKMFDCLLFGIMCLTSICVSAEEASNQINDDYQQALERQLNSYPVMNKGISFELKGFRSLESESKTKTHFEVSFGYSLKNNFAIEISLGKLNTTNKKSGGDLNDWQFVDQGTVFNATYGVIEFRKNFYETITDKKIMGFFAKLGLGTYNALVEYQYDRYKPYNGLFCLIGTCEKAVEESDSASISDNIPFYRLGGGYLWELKTYRVIGAINLTASVYYTQVLNQKVYQLKGLNHSDSFNTNNDLDHLLATVGVGTIF